MRTSLLVLLALAACRTPSKSGTDTGTTHQPATVDDDGDGYASAESGGDDCDDTDASVRPDAQEVCDGIDNDCDGDIDEGVMATFYTDSDGDGYGDPGSAQQACEQPSGTSTVDTDCDDQDADTWPGAEERCDEVDNDCDGEVDEDVTLTWYQDADGDGYGDPATATASCDPPSGYVADATDCDDTDPDTWPDASEVCDERDNDCDGDIDEDVTLTWYQDADGDGYGADGLTTQSCTLPSGYAATATDCDDTDAAVNPDATELCDEIDNDCDGDTDEDDAADALTWFTDADADGFGDPSTAATACDQPTGQVADDTDCDDTDAAVNPDATELCDEIDNDCNGDTDEDAAADALTWFTDADADGFGDPSTAATACDQPTGQVADDTDCDDTDAAVNPDATELCDEIDNDCDGDTDELVCLDLSNVDPSLLEESSTSATITADATIDTDTGEITGLRGSGTGAVDGIWFEVVSQSSGPDLGVFVFDGLTLDATATLTAQGDNGLVLLSTDDVELAGVLDASGASGDDALTTSGPNAGGVAVAGGGDGGDGSDHSYTGATAGVGTGAGGVGTAGVHYGNGGGGAGHCYGGGGGMGDRPSVAGDDGTSSAGGSGGYAGGSGGSGGDGGDPYSVSALEPLTAGSGGGGGLSDTDYNPNGAGGGGGAGGGAVQISVDGTLTISGTLTVTGGDGGDAWGGGGGGGAGGALLLEALDLDISGTLDAQGGGGGDGDLLWNSSSTTGGTAGGGASGMYGGGGQTESGGGGGASGSIYLRYLDSYSVTGSVAPSVGTDCASDASM